MHATDTVYQSSGDVNAFPKDGFELTITDGELATIVIITPLLNNMIQQSQIKENSLIKITKYRVIHDEKAKGKRGIILIQSVDFIPQPPSVTYRFDDFADVMDEEKGNIYPLISSRGYYLPRFDDDNFNFNDYAEFVGEMVSHPMNVI